MTNTSAPRRANESSPTLGKLVGAIGSLVCGVFGSKAPTAGAKRNTDWSNTENRLVVMTDGGLNDMQKLNLITQATRASLVQDIIGHPEEMPSAKELKYMNPSKSRATILEHLDKLMDAGIVERVELSDDQHRARDLPSTFYQLSDEGWSLLEDHNVLVSRRDEIKDEYERVEKTDEIIRYQQAPRPSKLVA